MRRIDKLSELTEMVGGQEELYLRHSGGPESDADGTSRDYESELVLPGLSVVPLKPPQWWSRPREDWIARQIRKYAHLAEQGDDRYAWILTGRVCDFGPDHEPLVTDFRPVAALTHDLLKEAEERYHDRFEVGRDSLQ
ncbi:MAG: DUF6098 family protein [Actinoallomurus sp.]